MSHLPSRGSSGLALVVRLAGIVHTLVKPIRAKSVKVCDETAVILNR